LKASNTSNRHLFICTGKDCQKKGCEILKSEFKKHIKINKIKEIRLIKTKCMDYCKLGPNLVINGKLWHNCQSKDVSEILSELMK
jgi:NADH-quinone oxidoreductase subunit F